MTTIEKIEKGIITLAEFTEDQQSFIRGIVKLSFNDGQEQALRIHDVVFLPDAKLPEKEYEDEPESVEVGVMIEGEHFTAYYNYDDEYWWVHFGGITVGHRKLDDYDVEGWYYLAKK